MGGRGRSEWNGGRLCAKSVLGVSAFSHAFGGKMKTWQADRMCVEKFACTFVGLWEDFCVVLFNCSIEPFKVFFGYERFPFLEQARARTESTKESPCSSR